jgi:hypothetical protein
MISVRDIENFDMFELLSYCEDCGDHCALTCPHCDDQYDHVWAEEIEVR